MKKRKVLSIILAFMIILGAAVPAMASEIRISGANRYETAVKISNEVYSKSECAILANGHKFVDALPGATLANILKAPILLVSQNSVPIETKNELERLGVNKIYILGGKSTIDEKVENSLIRDGFDVIRIGGINRYETSELVFEEAKKHGEINEVTIASNEADAVSSSGYRRNDKALILINNSNPSEFIKNLNIKKICLGGFNSISEDTYAAINASKRIAGKDRFETAVNIAKESGKDSIILVNGYSFVDAFTGSTFAYQKGADILLADNIGLSKVTADYIGELKPEKIYTIGGENSVTPKAVEEAKQAVSGEGPNTSNNMIWKEIYKEVLRGEREVLVSNNNKKPIYAKLNPNETTFNLLDFDRNGIPELVIKSSKSYFSMDQLNKLSSASYFGDKWVNAYIYTVSEGKIKPIFNYNYPGGSAVRFHYIGFTDKGYRVYSEMLKLFSGGFDIYSVNGDQIQNDMSLIYNSSQENSPTKFLLNQNEVSPIDYNKNKFNYYNGRYEFVSYPATEDNLSYAIDAYPQAIQKKPYIDWKLAYKNLLENGDGFIRLESDLKKGIRTGYPAYNYMSYSSKEGYNIWADHNHVKAIATYDINNDGIPELIVNLKSPHKPNSSFCTIQIFTFQPGSRIAKMVYYDLIREYYMKYSGIYPKNREVLAEHSGNQIVSVNIHRMLDDTMEHVSSYNGIFDFKDGQRIYWDTDIETYIPGTNETVITDFSSDEYTKLINEYRSNLISFENLLMPRTQENINKILK